MSKVMQLIEAVKNMSEDMGLVGIGIALDEIGKVIEKMEAANITADELITKQSQFIDTQSAYISFLEEKQTSANEEVDNLIAAIEQQGKETEVLANRLRMTEDKFDLLNGIMLAMLAGAPTEPLIRRYQVIFGR